MQDSLETKDGSFAEHHESTRTARSIVHPTPVSDATATGVAETHLTTSCDRQLPVDPYLPTMQSDLPATDVAIVCPYCDSGDFRYSYVQQKATDTSVQLVFTCDNCNSHVETEAAHFDPPIGDPRWTITIEHA